MRGATRAHAGKYLLTATNASGKDKAELEVTVLGKPTPPEGPLEVTGIYEDHCNLEWKPPADDGGLPIDYVCA